MAQSTPDSQEERLYLVYCLRKVTPHGEPGPRLALVEDNLADTGPVIGRLGPLEIHEWIELEEGQILHYSGTASPDGKATLQLGEALLDDALIYSPTPPSN